MPAQHRESRRTKLNAAFTLAEETIKANGWEPSLQALLSQHLCVLLSGFAEAFVEDVLRDYALTHGDWRLQRAASWVTDRFQNPKAGRLEELLATFDQEWGNDLKTFFGDDPARRDALNSVVANKNKIAHGEDSNVSYVVLRSWRTSLQETAAFVEGLCLP